MANPLSNEAEIFDELKKLKSKANPPATKLIDRMWELINHYVGNDVHAIQFIVGSHVVSDDPEPIPVEDAKKILDRCDAVRKFHIKLKEATKKKG